jgi:hypothetical protein
MPRCACSDYEADNAGKTMCVGRWTFFEMKDTDARRHPLRTLVRAMMIARIDKNQ